MKKKKYELDAKNVKDVTVSLFWLKRHIGTCKRCQKHLKEAALKGATLEEETNGNE